MNKFPPRRFLVNFVDGTAEFNDDATPPAQEYVSLIEYENLQEELAEMTDNYRVTSELFEALSMDHGVLQEKLRDEMKMANKREEYTDYLKEQLKESQEAHFEECRINGMGAQRELRLMTELRIAKEALEKIANPCKRDHYKPGDYSTLQSAMNIADEALKKLKG